MTLEPPSSQRTEIAVVGAHLSGMPLNSDLVALDARFVRSCQTAPCYRLYALSGTTPPKPGLVRVEADEGAAIAIEVWSLTVENFGRFVASIPLPLGIGTIKLEQGETIKGFIVEPIAIKNARDITHFGGWRAYMAANQVA